MFSNPILFVITMSYKCSYYKKEVNTMSSVVSVRINEQEAQLLKHASTIYGCPMSSLLKKLAFEKLEDDYDISLIREYEKEKQTGKLQTRPMDELFQELGI